MKRSTIIALISIALAVGIIISTAGDASSYVTFVEARKMNLNGNSKNIHVVGELIKEKNGSVRGIFPSSNKLSFTFLMKDEAGMQQEVFYNQPIPPDFERSEKIVVVGAYNEDLFLAQKILMKCPSKYQENTLKANY